MLNYTPSSAFFKLFEKLVPNSEKLLIEHNRFVPGYQFGFQQNHSTVNQLLRNTDIIRKALQDMLKCIPRRSRGLRERVA